MSTVEKFKTAHARFSDALKYITENEVRLKSEAKWDKIKKNFFERFEIPLDEAWAALTPDQQKSLAPLYLFRRSKEDPVVQKVINVFDAEIKSVEI